MMEVSLTIEQLERDIWEAPGADVSCLVINVIVICLARRSSLLGKQY
jgi:hypothetical protein